MIPQICLISAVIAALPLEVESNEKSLSGGMSSRQFLGSSNYACDHHTDVCSIAVQGVGMRASDSLMAYGHDSIPKAASSNTIRVPDSNRLIGGTQQLDMPGEEWVFTIDINSLDPGRYDLYVFTASDEIYLGVLVVVDLGMDSGPGDTTTPIPTTMAFTTGVLIPIIPTTGTIEDSDGSNSIAIYVGLIGGLSGGLLGIVCILIAACAYCGWSARRKGFKELKDIESYYSRDDGRCDNDDSASIISRHINALHHITSSNGVDIHQDSNDDDIHSELSLLSLDPLCHLAATTTGGMPHDEEGVRRGAIPGEPIAPAPSIRRNGNFPISSPSVISSSLGESTLCSTTQGVDNAQVGAALRLAARMALAVDMVRNSASTRSSRESISPSHSWQRRRSPEYGSVRLPSSQSGNRNDYSLDRTATTTTIATTSMMTTSNSRANYYNNPFAG